MKSTNEEIQLKIIIGLKELKVLNDDNISRILQKNPSVEGKVFQKSDILAFYREQKDRGLLSLSAEEELIFLRNIKLKQTRTISGVTTVTALTKPFPCPGNCIFCPNDIKMPKSYISSEPGAQRAAVNFFDPYLQTFNRLVTLRNIGHNTDKIELLILGGTWSVYPENYQIWFVKRCFDAMNDFSKDSKKNFIKPVPTPNLNYDDNTLTKKLEGKKYNQIVTTLYSNDQKDLLESATWDELYQAQKTNEESKSRCIGLVLETRPDNITKDEILKIRKFGATKIQIGVQSLNDKVLKLNHRGHSAGNTLRAISLIRQAGFKIHIHWMPNLYGSTTQKDIKDYKQIFNADTICPDEIKIYPCSLLAGTELMDIYKKGKWKPYSQSQLKKVITQCFINTPRYCRITRVIRDIPGTEIVVGNKTTNFRQIVEAELQKNNYKVNEIRSREIRNKSVDLVNLFLKVTSYLTRVSEEYFLEYVTRSDEIAGYLRLSLPRKKNFTPELNNSAVIREIHIYGESLELGETTTGAAQHIGLGKKLIEECTKISKDRGFSELAVISSVGTRQYYVKNGFSHQEKEELYQHKVI